jgi:hypothetical protein
MAEVVVEAALSPTLPANMSLVGEAVRVAYCSANPSEVTLRFAAGQSDPRHLLVVRVDEEGSVMSLPVVVDSDSLAVNIDANGTYAAIELRPPDNCTQTTRTDIVTANIDASLEVLRGVTHLHGDLVLGGSVSNVDAARCLTWISGSILVSEAASLLDLEMDGLAFVGGGVFVMYNPALTRASFARLFFVGTDRYGSSLIFRTMENFTSVELPSLVDVPGTIQLAEVGFGANAPFELGLGRLETVGKSVELFSVKNLANLDGLENLKAVEGELLVSSSELTQIDGLANLQTVGLRTDLSSNTALQSANLPALRALGESYGISFSCSGSPAITSLDFLGITELSGDVRLAELPKLQMVDFRNLVETTGSLMIETSGQTADQPLTLNLGSLTVARELTLRGVSNLSAISGLGALQTLTDALIISDNPELTGLQGLSALEELGNTLLIRNNAMLPTCEALSLRDRLEMNGFYGTVTISGNLADTCQ